MAREKALQPSFVQDVFHVGVYKRSQGKLTRQVTFAAIAVAVLLGCWQLSAYLASVAESGGTQYLVPGLLCGGGLWLAYRAVNFPKFADFLISVDGELAKVSWPTRLEVVRSTIVVIFVIFMLAGLLFAFDFLWKLVFSTLGIVG